MEIEFKASVKLPSPPTLPENTTWAVPTFALNPYGPVRVELKVISSFVVEIKTPALSVVVP